MKPYVTLGGQLGNNKDYDNPLPKKYGKKYNGQTTSIPIPKREDLKKLENYRRIALMPNASKMLLKIFQKRLEPLSPVGRPDWKIISTGRLDRL